MSQQLLLLSPLRLERDASSSTWWRQYIVPRSESQQLDASVAPTTMLSFLLCSILSLSLLPSVSAEFVEDRHHVARIIVGAIIGMLLTFQMICPINMHIIFRPWLLRHLLHLLVLYAASSQTRWSYSVATRLLSARGRIGISTTTCETCWFRGFSCRRVSIRAPCAPAKPSKL